MIFKKILVAVLILGIFYSGCEVLTEPLVFTTYPEKITEGEPFDVDGKYINQEGSEEIKVFLFIKDKEEKRVIKSREKILQDNQNLFSFSGVILEKDQTKGEIFFELKLFKDGKLMAKTDTEKNPSFPANWNLNIKTTYFQPKDDEGEPLKGTWNNYLTEENPFYFALPYRDFYQKIDGEWKREKYYGETDVKNRWIKIRYRDGEEKESIYAQWVDVGPWNYYDPHYVFEQQRPYAEMGIDMGWTGEYRETNKAGLDISPKAMEYLGEKIGKDLKTQGIVELDWRFIAEEEVPEGPWMEKVSTDEVSPEEFNLETETLRNLNGSTRK